MRKKRTSLREWTGKLCQIVRIMKITLLLVFLSLAQFQSLHNWLVLNLKMPLYKRFLNR